jgi:hypothetical protein
MKILARFILFLLLSPGSLSAAQMLGTIRQGGNPLPNAAIQVSCGGHRHDGKTDQYGSYSINIPEKGKCSFFVTVNGRTAGPVDVFSYDDPVRADFDVIPDSNGNLALRRR